MVLDVDSSDRLRESAAQTRFDEEVSVHREGRTIESNRGPEYYIEAAQETDTAAVAALLSSDLPFKVGDLPGCVLLTADMKVVDPADSASAFRSRTRSDLADERGL